MDPFASTADAASYLPREATESALARLEEGFRRGRRVQVLSGPPGLGKTLLLHVLAARLEDVLRSLYLPYASLSFPDLCSWILGLLGEPTGSFPDRELLASARRSALRDRPLLLLVDEASGIPKESAEGLAELVAEAEGALRLLLVPVDDSRAGRMLAVLARDVEELRLSAPLTLDETERYVRTRLVRAGVSEEVLCRFDADTVARLHRASGGNLRHLHRLAGEVMRGNLSVLPEPEARAELGAAASGESDALEIDAAAAGEGAGEDELGFEEAELPALRSAARAGGAGAARAGGVVSWPGGATPGAASPARAAVPRAVPVAAPQAEAAAVARAASAAAKPAAAAAAQGEGAAVATAPEPPYEPPLGPREPERTNWWVVAAVNLALIVGAVAGLWFGGLFPPPAQH